MKTWIFLSAHFDDAVLSAGGLIWELTRRGGRVEIWTVCAGDPPAGLPLPDYAKLLHGFWDIGDDVPRRRALEDAACCAVLGAAYRRYTVPDNIYRRHPATGEPVIRENEDQFQPLEPDEAYLIPPVADFIVKNLPADCELAAPLAIGGHCDHVLTRRAAERTDRPLWHYADYPYLVRSDCSLADFLPPQAEAFSLEISPAGLAAWQEGFACQRSQIPLVFVDEDDMRTSIAKYLARGFGNTLWKF